MFQKSFGEKESQPSSSAASLAAASSGKQKKPSAEQERKEEAGSFSKTKSSMPSISLPKGGGAIKGIGEKFQMNPVTGTGSLSVPIFTTPGRADFYPKLSLDYDSGAGNGPFGVGWNLSIPSITRKTDKGLPKYQDYEESDTFILSGAEDLVPALVKDHAGNWIPDIHRNSNPDYDIRRYRPRIEGLFARIEKWERKTTGEVHWQSISKDNVTSIYGKSLNCRISDPEDDSRVFQWLLEESYDDKGNILVYEYKQENNENIDPGLPQEKNRLKNGYANRYLKRILYGNQTPFQKDLWHFEIVFDYGEHDLETPGVNEFQSWPARPDAFSSYRAGFEIRTQRLCQRVLMFHHFPQELEIDPYLVRATKFEYRESPVLTYLTSVKLIGYLWDAKNNEYKTKELPPLEFGYSPVQINDEIQSIDAESLENLPIGLDDKLYQWVDLDGEGISGILTEQGNGWFYKRNLGNIPFDPEQLAAEHPPVPPTWQAPETVRFAPTRLNATKPSLANLRTGQTQIMDLAGDGQKDLVLLDDPVAGFFERTDDERWESFTPFSSHPKVNWKDPNLKFTDLNGDGHTDILITENDVFTWYPSKAEEGFAPAAYVRKAFDEELGPTLIFADATQSVYLADMSGDGLTDIVRIRNGEICYWPNLGYGRFGAKVTMDNAPYFDFQDQFNQNRIRLADIDGSGTTDIIYLGSDRVQFWFNQSGNSWSGTQSLNTLPLIDNLSSVMVIDLLGNGTACIVWCSPLPNSNSHPMCYIDLMGNQKPHLMLTVKNNMGAETILEYASSTKFYLEDLAKGKPWITKLPFPVHVLERVENRELITDTKFVSRYRYHHGYFDGQDREFRGFGMVEQWDTENFPHFHIGGLGTTKGQSNEPEFHQPPVYTKTWFHTGCYLDQEHISRQYANEYYQGDSKAWLLDDTILPSNLTTKEEHEACRALKGRVLRQEIYAVDDSPESRNPYQVTENSYALRLVQPMQDLRHAVFFTHEEEIINYYYERNPNDPRISHGMTIEVDHYGNVRKSVAIGYPRRPPQDPNIKHPSEQTQTLVILTENEVFNQVDGELDWYRAGVPIEIKTYELTGPIFQKDTKKFTVKDIQDFLLDPISKTPPDEIPYETIPDYNNPARQMRGVEHRRTLYYNDNLSEALPLFQVGLRAIPYESYTLVFTPGLLHHIFGDKIDEALLQDDGQYRKGGTLKSLGYFPTDDDDNLWWIPSGIQIFDPTQFFLPVKVIDPFQAASIIEYDDYRLMPIRTIDALNNTVTAVVDYRAMQPYLLTDPNANQSVVQFDELGMVIATAVMGKNGEGDTLADPTTKLEYELFNWMKTEEARGPNYVHTAAREKHGKDNPRWQESFSYSDGLGREVLQKIQAEPGLAPKRDENGKLVRDPNGNLIWGDTTPNIRWVGTGRTVVDNKGNPIKQYEPFFDSSHVYVDEDDLAEWGVTPIMGYDPLGRLIRTDNPNGTYSKVEFDAWQQTTWDENDTVILKNEDDTYTRSAWFEQLLPDYDPKNPQLPPNATSEQMAAFKAAKHADTPGIAHLDALGRTFLTIAKNTVLDERGNVAENVDYTTHTKFDIEGNPLIITDARGNAVMEYVIRDINEEIVAPAYDIAGQQLYQNSMDAGERWMLNNVAGNPIRLWDSRGHRLRHRYDMLQRLTHLFVQQVNKGEWLAEKMIYGEDHSEPEQYNLRGNVYQQLDAAGLVTNEEFDFKGNLLLSSRQLAKQYQGDVDWSQAPDLEDEVFVSSTEYDALNRPISLITPHTNEIPLNEIKPIYNEANLLEQVEVRLRDATEWTPFVTNIDYNAKGQRELIQYDNGVQTKYEYDEKTFRLKKLHSTRPDYPKVDKQNLQELYYTYDPVGNITQIRDEAQQDIYFNNGVASPDAHYEYDALYQLILADGREHVGQVAPPYRTYDWNDAPRRNLPHPHDATKMTRYTEQYKYDEVGNILNMIHKQGNSPGGATIWNRWYQYATNSNRLMSTSLESDEGDEDKYYSDNYEYTMQYKYDEHGNMKTMPHLTLMQWDFKDMLQATSTQKVNSGTPETTYYVYDSSGQRVRKVTENYAAPGETPTRKKERLYLGGSEIYREFDNAGDNVLLERETLHIMDDQQRIARIDTKTIEIDPDTKNNLVVTPIPVTRFQIGNHLGSASLELDENSEVISYEEYYPYGNTSYQAGRSVAEVSLKRHRYTAMERDEETGLNYHTARYYIPWLGRWISVDLKRDMKEFNYFLFCKNNPLIYTDQNGFDPLNEEEINRIMSLSEEGILKEIVEKEIGEYQAAPPLGWENIVSEGEWKDVVTGEKGFYWVSTKEQNYFMSIRELYIFALEHRLKISIYNANIEESFSNESTENAPSSLPSNRDIEKKEKPIKTPVTDLVKDAANTWYGWTHELSKLGLIGYIPTGLCFIMGGIIETTSKIMSLESMEKSIIDIIKGDDVIENVASLAWDITGGKLLRGATKWVGKFFKAITFPSTKEAFKQVGLPAAWNKFKGWLKGNMWRKSNKVRYFESLLEKIDKESGFDLLQTWIDVLFSR